MTQRRQKEFSLLDGKKPPMNHCPECCYYLDGFKQATEKGAPIFFSSPGYRFYRRSFGTVAQIIGVSMPCNCAAGAWVEYERKRDNEDYRPSGDFEREIMRPLPSAKKDSRTPSEVMPQMKITVDRKGREAKARFLTLCMRTMRFKGWPMCGLTHNEFWRPMIAYWYGCTSEDDYARVMDYAEETFGQYLKMMADQEAPAQAEAMDAPAPDVPDAPAKTEKPGRRTDPF